MARLEDIPKKEFFTTPEHYFDTLPERIRSRIDAGTVYTKRSFVLKYAVRFALPVLAVVAVILFYTRTNPDAETILASVNTKDLILYLDETGMTMEDVLETVEFTSEDLDAIENEVFQLDLHDTEIENLDQ